MIIASLEDDLVQAELIARILTEAGYECRSFHQGKDLLAALAALRGAFQEKATEFKDVLKIGRAHV